MPSGSRRAWAWTGSGTPRLLGHAVFPSGFRLQVGPTTQGYHAQPFPCYTGIELRCDAAHAGTPPEPDRGGRLVADGAGQLLVDQQPRPATGPVRQPAPGPGDRRVGPAGD